MSATAAAAQPGLPALTLVAPAAPGGGWDQTARTIQQVLQAERLADTVTVENVPGAAGTIGLARFVSAERASTRTLLVTGLVMLSAIVTNGSPVTLADTTPIARLTGEFEAIVVPAASPYRTLADLVDAFVRDPGAIAWGGGSAGGIDQVLVWLLAQEKGIEPPRVNYIAFAGGGEALAAVLGAQVTAGVSGWGEFAAQVAAGRLRVLALSAPARVAGLDVPTLREHGFDLDLANWRGIVAPPGLPAPERDALRSLVERMVHTRAWQAALARNGWTDLYLDADDFARAITGEQARMNDVLAHLASPGAPQTARRRTVRVGPWTFPAIIGLAAVLLGATGLGGALGRRRAGIVPPLPAINRRSLGMLAAGLVLAALLIERAGFLISGLIVFVAAARAFGSARPARDLLAGAAFVGSVYLVFTRLLGVALPGAPW